MEIQWRLIKLDAAPINTHFATEEVIRSNMLNGSQPTFIVYRSVPSVSIASYQRLDDINTDYAKQNDIHIGRRPTGGMANYHNSETDFSWSVVFGRKHFGIGSKETAKAYKLSNRILYDALKVLGIESDYHGSSIDTSRGRITSSAQAQGDNSVLIHGYMFFEQPDFEETFRLIRTDNPQDKIDYLRKKVAYLSQFGRTDSDFMKVIPEVLGGRWGELTKDEVKQVENVLQTKYLNPQWILDNGNLPRGDCLSGGEVLDLRDRVIYDRVN